MTQTTRIVVVAFTALLLIAMVFVSFYFSARPMKADKRNEKKAKPSPILEPPRLDPTDPNNLDSSGSMSQQDFLSKVPEDYIQIQGIIDNPLRPFVEIKVGTPPQTFRMLLDTGWRYFWVNASSNSVGSIFSTFFDKSKSSSFSHIGSHSDGAHGVVGFCGKETVQLGNTILNGMSICFGEEYGPRFHHFDGFDGIIGLAPSSVFLSEIGTLLPSITEKAFCFVPNAYNKAQHEHYKAESHLGFDFVVGKCGSDKPMVSVQCQSIWLCSLSKDIKVIDDAGNEKTLIMNSKSFNFDSGSDRIYFSSSDFDRYKALVGGSLDNGKSYELQMQFGDLKFSYHTDGISNAIVGGKLQFGWVIFRDRFVRWDYENLIISYLQNEDFHCHIDGTYKASKTE